MSENNYPSSLTFAQLVSGNIFRDLGVVTHLGIQATPGTLFYLNNSKNPISVGTTGIYELDLEGLGQIFAIQFNRESLNYLDEIEPRQSILIDVVYEGAGN